MHGPSQPSAFQTPVFSQILAIQECLFHLVDFRSSSRGPVTMWVPGNYIGSPGNWTRFPLDFTLNLELTRRHVEGRHLLLRRGVPAPRLKGHMSASISIITICSHARSRADSSLSQSPSKCMDLCDHQPQYL